MKSSFEGCDLEYLDKTAPSTSQVHYQGQLLGLEYHNCLPVCELLPNL